MPLHRAAGRLESSGGGSELPRFPRFSTFFLLCGDCKCRRNAQLRIEYANVRINLYINPVFPIKYGH